MCSDRKAAVKAYGALAAVCWLWGTTYLAIRMGNESLPVVFFVSARFLVSGSLLLAMARSRRVSLPRGRELGDALLAGVLTLGVGNGCLTLAEHFIPSGIAALFVATTPFWMVGLEALFPGGERIRARSLAGLVVGFAGCALLVAPEVGRLGFSSAYWKGFAALQLGSFGWALGSIYNRNRPRTVHAVVNGAVQQLGAGLAFLPLALATASWPAALTARSLGAFCYLVVFGSIVGFSAYVYALYRLPVSVATIYAYINPVVAAWLGWVFYREPFGAREAAAMAVIFLGVSWIEMRPRRAVT
jgi:drug/metabolite transporter (DMT)-like permease